MKKENIIDKLEKEGYEVIGTKFDYCNVAGVVLKNGKVLKLADGFMKNGSYGVIENFKFEDVKKAILQAEDNSLYREDTHINSMADYFHFSKGWNERVKL